MELSASDVVYDLGAGDGRLLFCALEKGAGKVVGVELNSELVEKARETARSKGVEGRFTFLSADALDVSLKDASVVLCYLCGEANIALKPKFESELKPGTKVITETFTIPGWKPVRTVKRGWKEFYLYVIPAEKAEELGQIGSYE